MDYDFTDPDKTIKLLNGLQAYGMSDNLFRHLNHIDRQTIDQHRKHCESAGRFRPDSNNARVQRRLYYLTHMIKEAGK